MKVVLARIAVARRGSERFLVSIAEPVSTREVMGTHHNIKDALTMLQRRPSRKFAVSVLVSSLFAGAELGCAVGDEDDVETVTSAASMCGRIISAFVVPGYGGPRAASSTETYTNFTSCPAKSSSGMYVATAARAINDEYWAGFAISVRDAAVAMNCPQSCPAEITLVRHNPDGVEAVPVSQVTGGAQQVTNGYKCVFTADFTAMPSLRAECKTPPGGGGSGSGAH
jgi:hypothetical protein